MGMMDLLMGKKKAPKTRSSGSPASRAPANSTQFGASQLTQGSGSVTSVRKDLLRVALREMVLRNGIPQGWISADMLRTSSKAGEGGMHMRFQVRHWEPRLMVHGPALEEDFTSRLLALDPDARSWLAGCSWQFALDDTSACPQLPQPGSWTMPAPQPNPTAPAPFQTSRPAGVIEGPTMIAKPLEEVRADLERLLALRDDDMKRHGEGADAFAPTRPATF